MRTPATSHSSPHRWLRLILLILFLLALAVFAPSASLLPGAFAQADGLYAEAPLPVDNSPGYLPDPAAYLPDNAGYLDASISVKIEKTRAFDTDILLAAVQIADPSQIRTAMAAYYGSTATSFGATIAKHNNAVFAVSGDFFSIHSGGFIVRQGERYCNLPDGQTDVLVIDDRGDFHIFQKATRETLSAFDGVVVNSFCFGPALVIGGVPCTELKKDEAGPEKLTQRLCVAQTGPLSYLIVATEGPENEGSKGLTLSQFAEFVVGLNVRDAYNLDGGSSSTVVLNNEKINALSSGKIRPICDILYFATAVPAK